MSIIFIFLLFRSEKTAEKRADRGACGFIAASVLDVQEQEKRKRDNDMRRLSAVLLLGYQKRETTLAVSLFFGNRQRPTLPSRVQLSTLGAEGLNCCVRDGNRCFPFAIVTGIVECVLRTFTTA